MQRNSGEIQDRRDGVIFTGLLSRLNLGKSGSILLLVNTVRHALFLQGQVPSLFVYEDKKRIIEVLINYK